MISWFWVAIHSNLLTWTPAQEYQPTSQVTITADLTARSTISTVTICLARLRRVGSYSQNDYPVVSQHVKDPKLVEKTIVTFAYRFFLSRWSARTVKSKRKQSLLRNYRIHAIRSRSVNEKRMAIVTPEHFVSLQAHLFHPCLTTYRHTYSTKVSFQLFLTDCLAGLCVVELDRLTSSLRFPFETGRPLGLVICIRRLSWGTISLS